MARQTQMGHCRCAKIWPQIENVADSSPVARLRECEVKAYPRVMLERMR